MNVRAWLPGRDVAQERGAGAIERDIGQLQARGGRPKGLDLRVGDLVAGHAGVINAQVDHVDHGSGEAIRDDVAFSRNVLDVRGEFQDVGGSADIAKANGLCSTNGVNGQLSSRKRK
ncbi:hypothetical protein AAFF_G00234780 [Aldrovandia affinis]|uniref:Uncharacterized protein n=1 Tax=Aldrovandia affinis TaxID=143900 RepID=A0AAD7SV71_9TELE|nr:hypothetical protein AAFF_G00234780 [Aldrovandia affinis]